MQISDEVIEILATSTIEGNTLKLTCGQTEHYKEVNDVLERLGGKWKRGNGHLFPYNPTPLVEAVIKSKIMPPKNSLAFFPTPPGVVAEMFSVFVGRGEDFLYLEPSAGRGNIADAVCDEIGEDPGSINMHLVEIDPFNASVLRQKGYMQVYEQDFMEFNPGPIYDHIFMNPPFSVTGHPMAWAEHVLHAYDLLLPECGKLMAVVPTSVNSSGADLINKIRDIGFYEFKLPDRAFKSSGTGVSTTLIYIEN